MSDNDHAHDIGRMEPKNTNNIESGVVRTCLLYEYKLGTKAAEAARKICVAFGKNTISQRTAQQWFKKFNESGESIQDAPRSGRPKKQLNVDDVKMAVRNNPKITCQELSQMFNVSGETIRGRLHQLNIYWRQGKWIQLMKKKKVKKTQQQQQHSRSSPETISHEPCVDMNSQPTTFDHHHHNHQHPIRIDDKTADNNQENNVQLLTVSAPSPTESAIQTSIVVPLEISYHSGPDLRLISTTTMATNHHEHTMTTTMLN